MFRQGLNPQISPFPGGQGPHLTQSVIGPTSVPAKWHLNPSNGSGRVHECDRRQMTDRQSHHSMERCVAIVGITASAVDQ